MHCQKLDLCGNRNLQCNYDYEQPSCGGKNNFVAHVHQVTPTGPVQHTCCELQKSENKNIFGHDGNDCFVYELPDGSHSTTNSDYHKRKIHSVDPNEEFTVLNNIGQIPEQFDGYVGYRMKLFMLRNKSPPSLIVKAIERLPEGYRVTICRPRCGNFHREDSIGIHEKSENSPKTISGDIMHGKVQSPAEWTAASWSSWSSSSWSTWSTTKLIGENEEKNNKRGNIRGDRLKIDENDKTGQETVNNVNVQATGGDGGNGGQGFGGNVNGGGTGNGVGVANASGAGIRVGVGEKSNENGLNGNGKDKNDEIDDKLGKTKPENPDSSIKSPKDDLNEKNKNGDGNGKNNGEDESDGNGKGNGKDSGDGKGDGNGKSENGTGDENGKNKNDGNSGDGIDSERNGNGSGNGKSGEGGDKMTTIIEPDGSGQAVNKGDEEDKAKGNRNGEGDGNGSGNGKDGESDGKRNGKNETSVVGEANSSGNDNGNGTKVITGPSHLSSERTSEGDNSDKNKGSGTGNNSGNNNGEANLTGAGSDGNGGKFITDPSHLSSEKVDEGEGDGKNNGNSGNGNDNNKGDGTGNDLGDNNGKANLVGGGGDDQAGKASSAENAAEELTRINEEDMKNGNGGDNKGSDGSSDKLKESAESDRQGIPARNNTETSTKTTTSSPIASLGSISKSAVAEVSESATATGTEASSSSGSAGMNCFSGDMEVATISGTKRMDQLEVGDLILVPASGNLLKYEKVEMFYHREPETIAKFVEIKTENGKTLSLTALHLLPFGDCAEFSDAEFDMENIEALMRQSRFAYKIKKDECIISVNANGKLIADKVIFVGRRISKGIYSPMTVEGSVIANNVLASCFSQIESHTIQKLAYDALFGIYNLFGFMKDTVTEPTQEIPSMLNYIHQLSRHVLPFSKY